MSLQVQACSFSSNLWQIYTHKINNNNIIYSNARSLAGKCAKNYSHCPLRCVSKLGCSTIGVGEIADVFRNKVLIAAAVSAAIGQLSKPFTSAVFYGKGFDLKAAIQAGGFPSTHSSAAVATATTLGLERGLSDAIFGLAVVYASLIMYDAQGVRREVGTHAKELNRVLLRTTTYSASSYGSNPENSTNSFSAESSPDIEIDNPLVLEEQSLFRTNPQNASQLLISDNRTRDASSVRSLSDVRDSMSCGYSPLKESIGHTEIEVTAGALLGFLVSLAVCQYT